MSKNGYDEQILQLERLARIPGVSLAAIPARMMEEFLRRQQEWARSGHSTIDTLDANDSRARKNKEDERPGHADIIMHVLMDAAKDANHILVSEPVAAPQIDAPKITNAAGLRKFDNDMAAREAAPLVTTRMGADADLSMIGFTGTSARVPETSFAGQASPYHYTNQRPMAGAFAGVASPPVIVATPLTAQSSFMDHVQSPNGLQVDAAAPDAPIIPAYGTAAPASKHRVAFSNAVTPQVPGAVPNVPLKHPVIDLTQNAPKPAFDLSAPSPAFMH
jgi:hypothetical protein